MPTFSYLKMAFVSLTLCALHTSATAAIQFQIPTRSSVEVQQITKVKIKSNRDALVVIQGFDRGGELILDFSLQFAAFTGELEHFQMRSSHPFPDWIHLSMSFKQANRIGDFIKKASDSCPIQFSMVPDRAQITGLLNTCTNQSFPLNQNDISVKKGLATKDAPSTSKSLGFDSNLPAGKMKLILSEVKYGEGRNLFGGEGGGEFLDPHGQVVMSATSDGSRAGYAILPNDSGVENRTHLMTQTEYSTLWLMAEGNGSLEVIVDKKTGAITHARNSPNKPTTSQIKAAEQAVASFRQSLGRGSSVPGKSGGKGGSSSGSRGSASSAQLAAICTEDGFVSHVSQKWQSRIKAASGSIQQKGIVMIGFYAYSAQVARQCAMSGGVAEPERWLEESEKFMDKARSAQQTCYASTVSSTVDTDCAIPQ